MGDPWTSDVKRRWNAEGGSSFEQIYANCLYHYNAVLDWLDGIERRTRT